MYTKLDQWNKFSKIVNNHTDKYNLSNNWEGVNLTKHLLDLSNEINEKNYLIPILLAITAWKKYNELIKYNILLQQFLDHVGIHIQTYVSSKYKEFPDEYIYNITYKDIQNKIKHYINRINTTQDINESITIQDMLKISHFCCYLYFLITTGNAQNIE